MRFHHSEAMIWCAVFGLIHAITGFLYRLSYMFVLAALSALLLWWISAKGGDLLLVILWQGVAMGVAGGVKLWRFVRAHPISA
jgi:hypothetical protein